MDLALLVATVMKQYRHNQWGLPRSSSEELFNCKYNSTHIILSVLLGRTRSVCKVCGCSLDCNKSSISSHKSGLTVSSLELSSVRQTCREIFVIPITLFRAWRTWGLSSLSPTVTFPHTDPLYRCSTLHKDSKIPGPRVRDQQALNEGALQKSGKSKFKLFEARGRLKTHLLHLAQGGNAHL